MDFVELPTIRAHSLEEADKEFKQHSWSERNYRLRALKINPDDSVIETPDGNLPLTTLGLKSIARIWKYPVRNFQILDDGRIADDLNSLLIKSDMDHEAVVRTMDNAFYDVRPMGVNSRKDPVVPANHVMVTAALNDLLQTDIKSDEVESVNYNPGHGFLFVTKSKHPSFVIDETDEHFSGLFIHLQDYKNPQSSVSYRLWRLTCGNDAVGIYASRFRDAEAQYTTRKVIQTSQSLVQKAPIINKAYKGLKKLPISEFSVQRMRAFVIHSVGAESAKKIFDDKYMERDESKKLIVRRSILESDMTEFDMFNDITDKSKSLSGASYWKSCEAAGKFLDEYVSVYDNEQ